MRSICKNCHSYTYCRNKTDDMRACINLDKFPRPESSEGRYGNERHED